MVAGQDSGFSISGFLDDYESVHKLKTDVTSSDRKNGSSETTKVTETWRNDRSSGGDRSSTIRRERTTITATGTKASLGLTDTKPRQSPLNTYTPEISKALDAAQNSNHTALDKKRKNDGEETSDAPRKKSRFEGMTKEEKAAEVKRLRALKAARDAKKANVGAGPKIDSASGSAASAPASPSAADVPKRPPVKGSYAEILARGKVVNATAPPPVKIIHKRFEKKRAQVQLDLPNSRHVVERERKRAKELGGFGTQPVSARPAGFKSLEPSNMFSVRTLPPPKYPAKLPEPTKPTETKKVEAAKPTREKIEWKGTARPNPPAASSSYSKGTSKSVERDRDRDRYRSPERDRKRARSPVIPSKRYRYVESDEDDYDSASDMEAAGLDILEEEEVSRKKAIKEDLEAERQEKLLAARKAAKKKQGGRA